MPSRLRRIRRRLLLRVERNRTDVNNEYYFENIYIYYYYLFIRRAEFNFNSMGECAVYTSFILHTHHTVIDIGTKKYQITVRFRK